MSNLPATNGEIARKWINHAASYFDMAATGHARGDNEVGARSLVSSAEMAIKAVYILHETYFPRTHDTRRLIDECPDRSVEQTAAAYPAEFVEDFAANYLAPYMADDPVLDDEFEACRGFAERILAWATAICGTSG